ncbi:unnamed protein product [Cochlearia groenlandica]
MGPRKSMAADKAKGKVTSDESLANRTQSGSIVKRDPTSENPREEPLREEPRRIESRKSNAKKKKNMNRDEPTVVDNDEDYEYVHETEPEEEEGPPGLIFPLTKSKTPLVRYPKNAPSSRELYDALMEVPIHHSHFPDSDTLKKLGIYDEVKMILRNMGIERTLGMRHRAYKEETCQFVATLVVILDKSAEGRPELANEPGESVQLCNFIALGAKATKDEEFKLKEAKRPYRLLVPVRCG